MLLNTHWAKRLISPSVANREQRTDGRDSPEKRLLSTEKRIAKAAGYKSIEELLEQDQDNLPKKLSVDEAERYLRMVKREIYNTVADKMQKLLENFEQQARESKRAIHGHTTDELEEFDLVLKALKEGHIESLKGQLEEDYLNDSKYQKLIKLLEPSVPNTLNLEDEELYSVLVNPSKKRSSFASRTKKFESCRRNTRGSSKQACSSSADEADERIN